MWYKIGLLTTIIAVVTLPAGLLTLLLGSPLGAAVIFIVGWLFLVPLIPLVALYYSMRVRDPTPESDDPLTALKQQYAAGEIDEAEFTARVETLIETDEIDHGPLTEQGPADLPDSRSSERLAGRTIANESVDRSTENAEKERTEE